MTRFTVPKGLREITPFWLTEALHSKGASSSASVVWRSAEGIAEGKGFMNQVVRLRLHYDDDPVDLPHTVIVKLPSTDPALRMIADKLGQDRREVRFYQEAPTTGDIQIPHGYYSAIDSATGNTILLLEDVKGGRQGDSVVGCSLAEAHRCIGQLAKFQASWWNDPRLDRLDWVPLEDAEAGVYQEPYAGAWESLIQKASDRMPRGLQFPVLLRRRCSGTSPDKPTFGKPVLLTLALLALAACQSGPPTVGPDVDATVSVAMANVEAAAQVNIAASVSATVVAQSSTPTPEPTLTPTPVSTATPEPTPTPAHAPSATPDPPFTPPPTPSLTPTPTP